MEEIRHGFLTYLLSHPRPLHEVINPTRLNMRATFKNEFEGMTDLHFSYADFESTRKKLVATIHSSLTERDRKLLVSFSSGQPDWSQAPNEKVQNLPAVRWKLQNINKMNFDKKMAMAHELEQSLDNLSNS